MRHIVATALGLVFCTYVHSLAISQRSPGTADTVPSYNQPSSPTNDQTVSLLIGLEQCDGPSDCKSLSPYGKRRTCVQCRNPAGPKSGYCSDIIGSPWPQNTDWAAMTHEDLCPSLTYAQHCGECSGIAAAGPGPSVPSRGQVVPSSEQAVPSSEQAVPSSEQAVPSSEQAVPRPEQAVPSSEQAVPRPGQAPELPNLKQPSPGTKQKIPESSTQTNPTSQQTPGQSPGGGFGKFNLNIPIQGQGNSNDASPGQITPPPNFIFTSPPPRQGVNPFRVPDRGVAFLPTSDQSNRQTDFEILPNSQTDDSLDPESTAFYAFPGSSFSS